MSECVKDRIIEFIRFKGITMKSFENKCDLSSGYVTSMRKGFGTNKLNNVLTAFPELNRDWLLYGEGEMLTTQPTTHSDYPDSSNATLIRMLDDSLNDNRRLVDKLIQLTEKIIDKDK
jgi:hypothetical protein